MFVCLFCFLVYFGYLIGVTWTDPFLLFSFLLFSSPLDEGQWRQDHERSENESKHFGTPYLICRVHTIRTL